MDWNDFLHSDTWNYVVYPVINIFCIGVLMWSAVSLRRERDYWKKKAKQLDE
jgi:hypothetical protein